MQAVNRPGEPDLSLIDQVPWIELSHAYGAAIDVPDQLRALAAADNNNRGRLLWAFTSNLFHQGSVYSATVAAIPVFQQLLRYRSVAQKPLILELLANFALGYPEDLHRVELQDCVGHSDRKYSRAMDTDGRECYLAVAAGAPLYEALLDDDDPQAVASACYLLAFFPAHAFSSCAKLAALAGDRRRPESLRCSALIACAYLDGGAVVEQYFNLLAELVENHSIQPDSPAPLLAAGAAYCVLRERRAQAGALRSAAQRVAEQALQHDVAPPGDGVYPPSPHCDSDDLPGYTQLMLHPDAAFPWGDLLVRLEKVTRKKSTALQARREKQRQRRQRKRLDPSIYDVQPNVFCRENVLAAVRRMHAWLDVQRSETPQHVLDEFEPFKPHLDLVWDEVVKLLDSDDRFISTAAESLVHRAQPLSDAIVNSLLERLHNGNSRLDGVLKKRPLSREQVQDMCDRLVSGQFDPGFGNNQHTYREIVCRQGDDSQLHQLFERGHGDDRASACSELVQRGLLDEHDPRVYGIHAADCMSSDPGRYMAARFYFAQCARHQAWFFSSYGEIPPETRWAVIEAMQLFRADLTAREHELRAAIVAEKSPLLKAKMIRLMSHFDPAQVQHIRYLLSILSNAPPPLERAAVAATLGNWLHRGLDEEIVPRLLSLASDESASVRRLALTIVSRGVSPDYRPEDEEEHENDLKFELIPQATDLLRRALLDNDEGVRRLAVYHLFRRRELAPEDLALLVPPASSDRVFSEALLAAALSPQAERFALQSHRPADADRCPLSNSVWRWATRDV